MRIFVFSFLFIFIFCNTPEAQEINILELQANACEKSIEGESLSSTRTRAADKATFLGIKGLKEIEEDKKRLDEHDLNVMIYRLVDEYVENLNVKTTKQEKDKVCVEVTGLIDPQNIKSVRADFTTQASVVSEESAQKAAEDVTKEIAIRPNNPENLALVFIDQVTYYNGTESPKQTSFLKNLFKDNPYFYLTEDKELADYTIFPKLLKAKVDALDSSHKRLQMVVTLDVSGIEPDITSVHQNRFLLFSAEDDEQEIAARLIKKLLDQAAKDTLRLIEHKEQLKLEKISLGHSL